MNVQGHGSELNKLQAEFPGELLLMTEHKSNFPQKTLTAILCKLQFYIYAAK